jgi:hypothetical protein
VAQPLEISSLKSLDIGTKLVIAGSTCFFCMSRTHLLPHRVTRKRHFFAAGIAEIFNHPGSSCAPVIRFVLKGPPSPWRVSILAHPQFLALRRGRTVRFVVGVNREAKRLRITLGITVEQYFSKWKDGIRKSTLSSGVRDSVLSNIDFNSFYGLGVIVITIPSQSELSYIGEEVYWRNGDSTERAETPKQIATLAKRF